MKTKNLTENENEIRNLIVLVKGKRKTIRDSIIASISSKFISLSKQKDLIAFPREHLNFLVDDSYKERTKRLLVEHILNYLIDHKVIREYTIGKAVYRFRNKQLISFDSGSYNLMMAKNGYKRVLSKYIKHENKPPIKKRVKSLKMCEELPEQYTITQDDDGFLTDAVKVWDECEIVSSKPPIYQAVVSNSNKSLVRELDSIYEKKVYEIIA